MDVVAVLEGVGDEFLWKLSVLFRQSTGPEKTNLFEVNAKDLRKELLLGRLGVPEHQDPKGRTWLEEVLG